MRLDKQYKHLMEQQNVDAEVNANFYEKLENAGTRRKSFRWKAALAVACIALMIPITVLAASNIFGKPKIKIGKMEYFPGKNGYSISFDNIENFTLSAFPENIQSIKKDGNAYFDSWQEAKNKLGIGLLNNTVLENDSTIKNQLSQANKYHCEILYRTASSKLYYLGVNANYRRQQMQMEMSAIVTVENPDLTDDAMRAIHSVTRVDAKNTMTEIDHEEYTTAEGIPVVIVKFKRENAPYYNAGYHAIFAVDNISYDILFWSNNGNEDLEREVVLEVLEGFVLNK